MEVTNEMRFQHHGLLKGVGSIFVAIVQLNHASHLVCKSLNSLISIGPPSFFIVIP